MSFSNPSAFVLLLLIPVFIYVGRTAGPMRRRRQAISLLLRTVLALLLIIALAGPQIPRSSDRLAVVFLVDVSDSMDAASQEAALDYVRNAIEALNPTRDQAAVVLFGADAVVEQPMTAQLDLSQIGANPITLNTDLAEAMRIGMALFPPESARRLVILSDGVETIGDAQSAARLAAATNVQVDYVAFAQQASAGEILVKDVILPPRVNEGELFDLVVNVASEMDTAADLRVFAGGQLIHQQEILLEAGDNRRAIGPLDLPSTGFIDFRVQVEPRGADGFYQNNELSAFTEVRGRPSVLLVAQDAREVEFLRPALEETGLMVDVIAPRDLPSSLAQLSSYSSIVLSNVSATHLLPAQMELLQVYVRDLGNGLVVIGGPESYGVGGYFETPLEETLPVEMRIRDQERIPSLTMLFIVDRSGSMEMSSNPQGFTNLELAKEAIIRSFNLLNDYDRTGVISFDTEAYYVLDLQEVGDNINRQQMESTVAALRAGGGTDIFGAVASASELLPNDPSTLKHIILLTDGGASELGILEMARNMYTNHGITLSVVAVGSGYAPWLATLAQAGNGNFHATMDVSTIPSIFAQETVLATRSYIVEEEFSPALSTRSPILEGIDGTPTLQGYVATMPKDTATVILRGPEEDPILASWQYGLGRSVAFTSDASARWGANWLNWEGYTRFWSQAIRWTITEGTDNNLEARIEQRGEQAYLVVDARDEDGNLLNGLSLDASLVAPNLDSQSLDVPQVAPGRYEAAFQPTEEGAYFMRIAGAVPSTGEQANASVAQTAGWVLSYSQEYTLQPVDQRFLASLAGITGGGSLADDPGAAFDHNLNIEQAQRSISPYLLALAALLLVVDIAVRRLIINREDWERLRAWFQQRLGMASPTPATTTNRMGGLMAAKRRATVDNLPQNDGPAAAPRPAAPPQANPRPEPAPRTASPTRGQRAGSAGGRSVASELLKRKREDQEN